MDPLDARTCANKLARAIIAAPDIREALPKGVDRSSLFLMTEALAEGRNPDLLDIHLRALSKLRRANESLFHNWLRIVGIGSEPQKYLEAEIDRYEATEEMSRPDRARDLLGGAAFFGAVIALQVFFSPKPVSEEARAVYSELVSHDLDPTEIEDFRPLLSRFTQHAYAPNEFELIPGLEITRLSSNSEENDWIYIYAVPDMDSFDRMEVTISFELFTPESFEFRFYEEGQRSKALKASGHFNRR